MKLIQFFKHVAAALAWCSMLVHASSSNDSDSSGDSDSSQFCPETYDQGVLSLGFNAAFLHVEEFNDDGDKTDGLTITSFFNVASGEIDKVALIRDLDDLDFDDFDPEVDVDELTIDCPGIVWPNEAVRAPDGVFPFEAVVIAQGFHPAPFPGRLTAIDVATKTEYVITQSTEDPPFEPFDPFDPLDRPRFYHKALFIDMDGDGLQDIVAVRSGFRVSPSFYPPVGELVWFRNPGDDLDANTEWDEVVLFGGPSAFFLGPDIDLVAYDFENDGVPEIVATHFFSAFPAMPGGPPPSNGKIAIYGAPTGGSWADVDAVNNPDSLRKQDISVDQGFPFRVELVDLNRDGKVDILATNHQPDGCAFSSVVPGRVYALEQPVSGDIFNDQWTTRIILDNIRPQPSIRLKSPGRLAPGAALTFFPKLPEDPDQTRPWIVVGGDQAGKVWILKPVCYDDPSSSSSEDDCPPSDEWAYEEAVVFDINDSYGPGTTQTVLPSTTVAVSTIGLVAVRYDKKGFAELYIPVFEAQDIHVISFKGKKRKKRNCPADVNVACPIRRNLRAEKHTGSIGRKLL